MPPPPRCKDRPQACFSYYLKDFAVYCGFNYSLTQPQLLLEGFYYVL